MEEATVVALRSVCAWMGFYFHLVGALYVACLLCVAHTHLVQNDPWIEADCVYFAEASWCTPCMFSRAVLPVNAPISLCVSSHRALFFYSWISLFGSRCSAFIFLYGTTLCGADRKVISTRRYISGPPCCKMCPMMLSTSST